jgi:hypothetical protein
MSDDDNRKPVWPWIVAVVILLPILYVALFGPAVLLYWWLDDNSPRWLLMWLHAPDPLDWLIENLPDSLSSYLQFWYRDVYLDWWRDLGVALHDRD